MRSLVLVALAASLCLGGVVHAQAGPDADSTPTADEQAPPSGPLLQPSDYSPVICDPAASRFRFLEVRGTGFDAWATQRLVGNLVDESGVAQVRWGSVWVSPQGRLTLEVNLCADPFRGRPALPAGNYTVAVGPGDGQPVAATNIALAPPPEAPAEGEMPTVPAARPPALTDASNVLTPTPAAYILPSIATRPTSAALSSVIPPTPSPTPGPRTGLGSRDQPFPQGAPGTLVDGWQLLVTGVTPNAWPGIRSAIPSSVAPASDQRDFMVRVQATYLGQGTGVFSAMRLALVSGIQTSYDELHNGCGIVPDMVPPNLVTAGGSVRGNVCFTVRASDIDSLVLFDNQAQDSDKLYFSLK